MKLKSFLKRIFGGEVIERIRSPINGEILVVKELSGKIVMRVGGIAQSGGIVEKLWREVIDGSCHAFFPSRRPRLSVTINQVSRTETAGARCPPIRRTNACHPSSVLILGLGAGTVAKILVEKWPGIKITGVEIDPEVIKIGKKHFALDKTPNLKIMVGDGIKAVSHQLSVISHQKYDLILVDMYHGQEFPKEAESEEFLDGLKKILGKNGLIIFNRLNFGKHKKDTEEFLEKLKKFFPKVSLQKTEFNLFIKIKP